MAIYERGDVRLHYEDFGGDGFPLLMTPGGGLQSNMDRWPNMPFSPADFKDEFRVITMDQRNSIPRSMGPLQVEKPWDAFADDQLGVLDHLGIDQFFALGMCIGGPFVLKLCERAPDRARAVVSCQPVGAHKDDVDTMHRFSLQWAEAYRGWKPNADDAEIAAYLHNLWRDPADFMFSVTREFVSQCETPILVMPDNVVVHPLHVAMEVVALAPKSASTLYPWKNSPENIAEAVAHVKRFLRANRPEA
jgi:pimeloyl-ACP methyl ester carboxylesterase